MYHVKVEQTAKQSELLCDFCGIDVPIHVYTAEPFVLKEQLPIGDIDWDFGYDEGWGACAACHGYIEREEWSELANRATEVLMKLHHLPIYARPEMRKAVVKLHNAFRQNRKMPA